MMTLYAVMISCRRTDRWIDTLWADRAAAEERAEEIRVVNEAMPSNLAVWITEMKIQDAKLGPPLRSRKQPEEPQPHE